MDRIPLPSRQKHCIALNYVVPEGRYNQIARWMEKLCKLLQGRLETPSGAVMSGPLDGFTDYYDIYTNEGYITTYEGLGYGHPCFVEISSKTEEGLELMRKAVVQIYGADNILGESHERQTRRVYPLK